MDYTSFVRFYYITALKKLNQFTTYKGSFATLNYPLEIDNNFLHLVQNTFDGLPEFGLNINAPISEYQKFFDYYGALMPELAIIFPNSEALNEIYEKMVLLDDGKEEERIELYIDLAIDVLKEQGVVVNNGNEI